MAASHPDDDMNSNDPPTPDPQDQMNNSSSLGAIPKIPKRQRVKKQVTPVDATIIFPRVRQYPDGPGNRWVVYFRPKDKPLRVTQISKDLNRYSSVLEIMKVGRDKLRVILSDRKQANLVVIDTRFTIEYRVYIPAHVVEVDGVVTEENLTETDLMGGIGVFKDPNLPRVKILAVQQLKSASGSGENREYSPSNSFRITFQGSALPKYVELYKLRLPVRLYVPKVMSCTNCLQLGHTSSHCANKIKCPKCGEQHDEGLCTKEVVKCILCGGEPHASRDCPTYKKKLEKLKRFTKERSKRSFAEIVKASNANKNRFAELSEEESSDSDCAEQLDSDESSGQPRKKKKTISSKQNRKRHGPKPKPQREDDDGNPSPPGLDQIDEHFPPLPAPPQPKPHPRPRVPRRSQEGSGLISFSTIVEWIINAFEISDPLKSLISTWLPTISELAKQIAAKWPLLSSLISFDG